MSNIGLTQWEVEEMKEERLKTQQVLTEGQKAEFLGRFTVPAIMATDVSISHFYGIARLTFMERAMTSETEAHYFHRIAVAMPVETFIALKNLLVEQCAKIEVTNAKQ